jgi:HPt (histidine-containing phosphotransfer) domain-containing protein
MNSSVNINWEQLHQISEDNPEFELELLSMLAEDVKDHITALRGAIVGRDLTAIVHEAHYIKGASANVGAIDLASAAKQIEHLARESKLEGSLELVAQMEVGLAQLENFLASENPVSS